MAVKPYNLKEITFVWGALVFRGNSDKDGLLEIEPGADDYELSMSADGVGSRAKTNDQSAGIKLKLAQTCDLNAQLSAIRLLGLKAPNGADIAPLTVRDRQGTTLCTAETAWIQRPPTVIFNKGIEGRQWQLQTDNMVLLVGGN